VRWGGRELVDASRGTLRITSDAPGAISLVCEVTLHADDDAVRLVTHLDKAPGREKEAVPVAFPLAVPGGVVRTEQGFAVVRPDSDQAERPTATSIRFSAGWTRAMASSASLCSRPTCPSGS
jgi:hypothetical protein